MLARRARWSSVRLGSMGAAALLTFALVGLTPRVAEACGGFFCSNFAPVVQTGERILFAQLDANTIEAHVQINYAGPSEEFAWVVPVPSEPELDVGSDVMFAQLSGLSRQVRIDWETEGTCAEPEVQSVDAGMGGGGASGGDSAGGGVDVLNIEVVGPFDTAVVAADDAGALMEWLTNNGYDLPEATEGFLAPYVGGDMVFLALKLTKGADAGDLQPITMRYTASAPMIPIQLTAVAAQDGMPVETWILADDYPAVSNYLDVELNPMRLALDGYFRAAESAIVAAHAARSERGMVRGFAGPAQQLPTFYPPSYDDALEGLRSLTNGFDILNVMQSSFLTVVTSGALGQTVLETCLPVPEALGVDATSVYNCPFCFELGDAWDSLDGDACADALDERLLEPLRHAQTLRDSLATASRFDTWLDADEMTVDPAFCYGADVGALETFVGQGTIHCSRRVEAFEAPRTVILEGVTYSFDGVFGQTTGDAAELPAFARLVRHRCGGASEVLEESDLGASPVVVSGASGNGGTQGGSNRSPNESGCAASGSALGGGWLLLLAFVRRRRTAR